MSKHDSMIPLDEMPTIVRDAVARTLRTLPPRRARRRMPVAAFAAAVAVALFGGALLTRGVYAPDVAAPTEAATPFPTATAPEVSAGAFLPFSTTAPTPAPTVYAQEGNLEDWLRLADGGIARVSVLNARYDGKRLSLEYEIIGSSPQVIEPFTPTEAERALMTRNDTRPMLMAQDEDTQSLLRDFSDALYARGTIGLHVPSADLRLWFPTPDGEDIPMELHQVGPSGDDIRGSVTFRSPLPEALQDQPSVTLSLIFDSTDTWYYVEEGKLYQRTESIDSRQITITVPRR